jgi:hypothetical protein
LIGLIADLQVEKPATHALTPDLVETGFGASSESEASRRL